MAATVARVQVASLVKPGTQVLEENKYRPEQAKTAGELKTFSQQVVARGVVGAAVPASILGLLFELSFERGVSEASGAEHEMTKFMAKIHKTK